MADPHLAGGDEHLVATDRRLVELGDLGPLWKALPELRHFEIESGEFALGAIEAPYLVFAKFVTGGLARECAQSIANATWPALEHAVIGNIVPDFPLINKSFNLSYSGHDL